MASLLAPLASPQGGSVGLGRPGADAMRLTVGPLQYWWPREATLRFYADVAESAAHTVVLGEVVCSRRNEFKPGDWLALARDLATNGKNVVLATQALVMSEAELRSVRRLALEHDEFAVEAGDASALRLLAQAHAAGRLARPFVLGPHINIYNRPALVEHAALGAGTWVPPLELAIDAVAQINPPGAPVAGAAGPCAPRCSPSAACRCRFRRAASPRGITA